ncbi:MAG: hypothetical protein EAS51_00365 [Microbacteriaceae bacterium]|nr:MAG: hypothetical protein EAS51_00365 [Microbacteriaceae bacterium]
MILSLVLGVGVTVLGLAGWIVGTIVMHKRAASSPIDPRDRAEALKSVALHEQATAGQMASMSNNGRPF